MSREIRITVADDEVFERMRRRKDALDLSWEEALRRGLDDGGHTAGRRDGGPDRLDPFDEDFRERLRERVGREVRGGAGAGGGGGGERADEAAGARDGTDRHRERAGSTGGTGQGRGFDPFDPESVAAFARRQARQAMRAAPGVAVCSEAPGPGPGHAPGPDGPGETLDAELDRLAEAEDAALTFPFLDAPGAAVPLRVTLETTGEGLAVEVVAVRSGKGTADSNRFPDDARQRVATALADGATARLTLQDGAEAYDVVPRLSWGRDDDGTPTVTEVGIERVVLGEG